MTDEASLNSLASDETCVDDNKVFGDVPSVMIELNLPRIESARSSLNQNMLRIKYQLLPTKKMLFE